VVRHLAGEILEPLLAAARVQPDDGVVSLAGEGIAMFLETAKRHRIWDREPKVRKE
jgi:hypothetical protein